MSLSTPDRRSRGDLRRPRRSTLAAGATALVALSVAAVGLSSPSSAGNVQAQPGSGPVVSPVRGKAPATAPVPTVSAPISGVDPLASTAGVRSVNQNVLDKVGYQVKEYFISGRARAFEFKPGTTASDDGRWQTQVAPGSETDYRTRVVVFTPKDPRRFSGNATVEWNNVTRGDDAMPDLIFAHNQQFRIGDAVIGVSAQFSGAEAARRADPQRRGSINHPGDSWSYDIFSQAGMAVRTKYDQLLGGLRPRTVLGDGESQSAIRLATYVNGVAPIDHVFDGYLVHSRAGFFSAPLQEAATGRPAPPGQPEGVPVVTPGSPVPDRVVKVNAGRRDQTAPPSIKLRTDLVEPTVQVLAQSDVFAAPDGSGFFGPATQAQSASVKTWQLAGTSHVDAYVDAIGPRDTGGVPEATEHLRTQLNPPTSVFGTQCTRPVNTGQENYLMGTALFQLGRWATTGGVNGGIAAASPALFAGQTPNQPGTTAPPQKDVHGNVVGGVRSPAVDVPLATLTGEPNTPASCTLAGSTTPFSSAKLRQLYPTKQDFVQKYAASVDALVRAGYILPPDGYLLKKASEGVTF